MVGNTMAWGQLADEFGWRKSTSQKRPTKIGLGVAEDEVAKDTTAADVERRETTRLINEEMGRAEGDNRQALEKLAEEYARGQRSVEYVDIILNSCADGRNYKVSGRP